MAKQPIRFSKQTGADWQIELVNLPTDELTGVEEVHFDIEAKGGPFVVVKFRVDSGTLQTPDN
jgi:hypothetical protein